METKALKAMGSNAAASGLIEAFPSDGSDLLKGLAYFASRNWKKADQFRLAEHFLQNLPDQSSKPYEYCLKVMRPLDLLEVIELLMEISSVQSKTLDYNLYYALQGHPDFSRIRQEIDGRMNSIFDRLAP